MARLEIPSIVVHAGSCSCPASPQMERAARTLQRSLSKQEQIDSDVSEDVQNSTSWKKSASVDTPCPNPHKESKAEAVQSQQSGEPPTADPPPVAASPLRQKSQNSKVKLLVRSHAMREETSPPPDPERATLEPPTSTAIPGARPSSRLRLKHQGSSQGSFDSSSPLTLSRDSSTEQPPTGDSSGVDLPTFLIDTVNRSNKDRQLLLRIEQDLLNLVRDVKRTQFKFPVMSSYQRMLVHRMAALFSMEHNVDTTGTQVVVARTQASRIPDFRLRDQIRGELEQEQRRSILKRDTNSLEDTGFKTNADSRRSKSFEEREEEYEKVRKRIFKQEGDGVRVVRGDSGLGEGDEVRLSQEELRGTWAAGGQTWSSSDSSDGRPQLLRPSPPHSSTLRPSRLLKVESFESRDHLRANSLRQAVSKSYSFGGYSGGTTAPSLARGDSMVSTHSAGARLLTKQDSGGSSVASRLSPLSSGYKSLGSQRSDATLSATPSPTATPMLPQAPHAPANQPAPTLVWAVTCMDAVPPGSVLINPQTGQPYLNSDGSVYRFDPGNPPRLVPAPDPPPVHSAPQPPSIQVHPSYTCAPAPQPPPAAAPPTVDYHQPSHMVYTYAATSHQQHTHQACHPQEVVGAVTELATFLSGLQMNPGETPPSAPSYVMAPAWQGPANQGPRPALLPPPSSPQQPPPGVVIPGSQQTVLLVPPTRPMFPGTEGYYSAAPQQMLPPPGSSNNPGSLYPSQHTLSPSTPIIRAATPGTEGVTYSSPAGTTYFPSPPAGMCASVPYCFSPAQVVGSAAVAPTTPASVWCHGCQQSNLQPQQQTPLHLNPLQCQGNIPGPSSALVYHPPSWQHPWHPNKLAAAALEPWVGATSNQPCSRGGQRSSAGRGLLLAGPLPSHCEMVTKPLLPCALIPNPHST